MLTTIKNQERFLYGYKHGYICISGYLLFKIIISKYVMIY